MTVCEGGGGGNYHTAKTNMTSKCKNLNEINPSMETLNNGLVLEGK